MKVSIIIPVYNMAQSIFDSVKSILSQTYENIELILVDDGSIDNSFELCKKLAEKNEIVKVFHTENRGSGPARNYGIEKATGDFVYFPDADDYVEPYAIEILVNAITKSQCDLVVFGYRCFDTKGRLVEEKNYPNLNINAIDVRRNYENYCNMSRQYGIQGAPWNKFFDLRKIKEFHLEFPALRRHQDEVFIARYVAHSQKICFINDVLYNYYKNDLRKEWAKYPITYSENVGQLRDYKVDIISGWNPSNNRMYDNIETEYICNYIKAMELSFNKKFRFTFTKRMSWIKEKVQRQEFLNSVYAINLNKNYKYQRKVVELIKTNSYMRLYLLLRSKVFFDLNIRWMFKQ